MDGVTILNTFTSPIGMSFVEVIFIILMFFTGAFFIGLVLNNFDSFVGPVIAGIVTALIVGTFAIRFYFKQPREETQYEVIISEEVDFKEFTENYEVIEQRGEIYIVRERVK